ncbi:molybdate transport system regulatory protein [Tepidamorphus gemmatus]|uniref:Molybdate transport system regulatory protein n=1 Tax=Tepidamorphus gemmatus TaxID=747076 RepID=A0A4R3MCN1_9HYPH|nr:winged helix-turn-helix domain-containing protein [Tepidamorphus gemmatus]TCT09235.1 molybdate transport system regulatory protein [Tepidamorphus gemmatus]
MRTSNITTGIRLRVVLAPGIAIGPGKADLLEGIRDTGSISAAGRRMKMSYKRAWTLVDSMNRWFPDPLVESEKGGAQGGGARLTGRGEAVLAAYRRMEASAAAGAAGDIAELRAALTCQGDMSDGT